jgi:ADP-ribosylglycohydrolase
MPYAAPVADDWVRRATGAVVGSAVGDALGAPFEFGPAGAFSRRFPASAAGDLGADAAAGDGVDEMRGGGGWEPGEATDDTQMAVLVGLSLVECGGFEPVDMFERFRRWAAAEPKDIGLQTEAVLTSGLPWQVAAADHAARHARAAGNGSIMRTVPAAVYFARQGRAATMAAARGISALTHGDPAAGEGCAILHELIRTALTGAGRDEANTDGASPGGADLAATLEDCLSHVAAEHRPQWTNVLDSDWHPGLATESNGAVWPTLGSAVWAVRTTSTFAAALRAAIDLGGDTDTVAAVTGGLAGALYGYDAIPSRWLAPLTLTVPGYAGPAWTADDLYRLAVRLAG